jgi:hypothetical protein
MTVQTIVLQNPVSAHFEAFIRANAPHATAVVAHGSAAGQHLVLCGAGPSLAETAGRWCARGDQVWGCNSAAPWLHEHGHTVTHAFTVDQTTAMCEEWATVIPGVEYLVASSIHPDLAAHLRARGAPTRWFHNYCGLEHADVEQYDRNGVRETVTYEHHLYQTLYPSTVLCGSGLNATTRAIDIARAMGFAKITVLGADCALRLTAPPPAGMVQNSKQHLRWLRKHTVMHADGSHAMSSGASTLTMGLTVDAGTTGRTVRPGHGHYWETKADLVVSAVWLVKMAQAYPEVRLVGDTLPNALARKDREYLNDLPSFVDGAGHPIEVIPA